MTGKYPKFKGIIKKFDPEKFSGTIASPVGGPDITIALGGCRKWQGECALFPWQEGEEKPVPKVGQVALFIYGGTPDFPIAQQWGVRAR